MYRSGSVPQAFNPGAKLPDGLFTLQLTKQACIHYPFAHVVQNSEKGARIASLADCRLLGASEVKDATNAST